MGAVVHLCVLCGEPVTVVVVDPRGLITWEVRHDATGSTECARIDGSSDEA